MRADPPAAPAAAAPPDGPLSARALIGTIIHGSSERSRAGRDAVGAFVVRAASAGILYLSQVVLARWLGSFEYGIYVFVWTMVLLLGGLSTLGFSVTMIRLLPTYREQRDSGRLAGLLFAGRLVPMAFATCLAVAGIGVLWLAGDAITGPYVLPAFIALFCLPLFTLSEVHDGIGRASGWLAVGLLPHYVLRPLLVLVVMAGARGAGWSMDATTAAMAAVIATWLASLIQLALIERNVAGATTGTSRRYDMQAWLSIAAPLMVIGCAELVLQNADLMIVSRHLSPSDVAVYFAAAKTMSLMLFVHYAVGSAMANRYAALNARGDRPALEAFVRDAVKWTFWPSLAGAALLLVLGRPLLWLFGTQFVAGYPVMLVLAIGFLARAAVGPAEFLLNMLGEQRTCAAILVLAAATDVALGLLLVPRFGIIGAAVATATALIGAAILQWYVARRRLALAIAIWENVATRS